MRLRSVKGIRGIIYRSEELNRRFTYAFRGMSYSAKLRKRLNGSRPSMSVVVVGRNDDYMPDFKERLQSTIEWNIRHIISEVIFVEWNPPPDRELLSFGLTKRFPNLRSYVVPAEIHQSVCKNPNVPLLEFHAKNVGIRRAKSPWIIVTNADGAFGVDTLHAILHSPLSADTVWTAQRVDIPWTAGRQTPIGMIDCLRYRRLIPYDRLGTGEFVLASRDLWERIRGYDETMVKHRWGCDTRGTAQMLAHGAIIQKAGVVLHLAHPTSGTEKVQPHHGEGASLNGLPYRNGDGWGLSDCQEKELADRVWMLG